MKIDNGRVYDMAESIKASGYPMSEDVDLGVDMKRAEKLAHVPAGSGHDCYLKGIVVNADVTVPQYFWLQFGRYHFADIVSSV